MTYLLLALICSIQSMLCYRLGGMSREQKHWLPVWMRHSWVRDWLCPLCILAPFMAVLGASWWFLLAYLLSVASLSTYWDFFFGDIDNFYFSGCMLGVALLPLAFCGLPVWVIVARALVLGIAWGIICDRSGNDFVEEYSRGLTAVLL